jgi:hypothetical protein
MRAPGIYYDISNEEYHADRSAIGNSGLKAVGRSLAYFHGQYLDARKPPTDDTEKPAQLFGNMVHCALFEHASYNARYRVGPEVNKNTNIWKDFKKECEATGCQPVDAQSYECGLLARESALRNPDIRAALSAGVGESTVYAQDPKHPHVRRKVRPDWVHPVNSQEVILLDGKTYKSADPDDFARQVHSMDYDQQDAFYSDTYELASSLRVLAFVFIVIENTYPYVTAQMQLDDEARRNGRLKYTRRIDAYAEALKTNEWPGVGHGLKTITLPRYALLEE